MDKTNLPPLPEPAVVDPGRFGVCYTAEQMHEYAAHAVREAVPDGMVLVPREPDARMLDAAIDAHLGFNGEDEVDTVWAAMIAAAPTQDQENGS